MALSKRQKLFVAEYLVDLNATQAAIRAGYSEKTAGVIASENLKKPNIMAEIQKEIERRATRVEITQDRVLKELANVAFANGTDFVRIDSGRVMIRDTKEVSEDRRSAIAGIKETRSGIEVKTYDKVRALELLGRHLGMFDGNQAKNDQSAVESFLQATRPDAQMMKELYDDGADD